ncbi:MAG TPA: DUF748 domain-containing protein [Planctomycetota bacterium]|nr:DUF748 domain-containing protein [Planctomycetota bacterium]
MATETQPAPAAAPKKSGLIRWKVLIFLVIAFLAFAFFGAGPLVKKTIQRYRPDIAIDSCSVNVFTMAVKLTGVKQADPADASKSQFTADEVRAKLALLDSLKGQVVVDELAVVNPKGRLTRGPDGSINGTPTEEKKPGESDSEWKKRAEEWAKKRDLVEDMKKLFQKLKEKHDAQVAEKQKQEEARKQQEAQGGKPMTPEEMKKAEAEYVKAHRPLVVVRHLVADGVEITLADEASGAPAQSITDGHLEASELSTAPSYHDKPITMNLTGKLAGAPGSEVKLDGKIDLTADDSGSSVKAHLANVPMAAFDAFYKNAIPVAFQGKSLANVDLPLDFKNWEIDWRPSLLLDQIDAKARDPNYKIAGQFQSTQVAQELTNAGRLALQDIRIHGPIWAPTVEGDVETIKQLLLQGGKAYAARKAQEKAQEFLDKNPQAKQAAEKAQDALNKTGLGDAVKNTSVGNALGGLLGGSSGSSTAGSTGSSTGGSTGQKTGDAGKKEPPKPGQTDKGAVDKAGDAIKGVGGSLFGGDKK